MGGRRADFGLVRVSERDLRLLAWIGEMYAISLPQLAVLMGRSSHAARWLRSRWQRAGWVQGRALLVGQPVFIWLTAEGRRMAGREFRCWRPNAARLAHICAVNDVRLHVDRRSPGSVWVCERQLARERLRRAHVPDAVVVSDGERHAIEVELVAKARARTEAIVAELLGAYDAAVYFCAPGARPQLEQLQTRFGPRLAVRELPALTTEREERRR
jgi:hypothetical protein